MIYEYKRGNQFTEKFIAYFTLHVNFSKNEEKIALTSKTIYQNIRMNRPMFDR